MPRVPGISSASPIRGQIQNIENKFTGGLITEASGLNFPENACTALNNCILDLLGTVQRREGMDFESGGLFTTVASSATQAMVTYLWQNVDGTGTMNFVVAQIGNTLYFWNVIQGDSISPHYIGSIGLNQFSVMGSADCGGAVCQFSAGNGYLFVVHPYCDPIGVSYYSLALQTFQISIQIRDLSGIYEPGVGLLTRPATLTAEHQYNLNNQGWSSNPAESFSFTGVTNTTYGAGNFSTGQNTFTGVPSSMTLTNGESLSYSGYGIWSGNYEYGGFGASLTVTSYSGTTLVANCTSFSEPSGYFVIDGAASNVIATVNTGLIGTWFSDIGDYPSNSDIWWTYADTSGVFDPTTTIGNVSTIQGQAPQGHYILSAFTQQRSAASGITGLTDVTTSTRPSTTAWFQGRVWYSGVNASFTPIGDATYYTWNQNIYFSQIITDLNDVSDFGTCYQQEDLTSQNLFDLLPDDGGVIRIADCGQIVKLYPIQGALIVFATNGIWTITGNTGLGFTADDYSVNRLSTIRCVSGTSFVDVLGFPMWWTQEGIYTIRVDVTAGGLRVDSLTDTTIKTFYQAIPLQSKQYAVGYYNPLTFTVTYLYRSTVATTYDQNFIYDSALSFNTITGAWSPWTFANNVRIHGILTNPIGQRTDVLGSPEGYVNSYLCSYASGGNYLFTFAQTINNTEWVDWFTYDGVGQNYTSYFECGYRVHGQGAKRFQTNYVFMYSNNSVATQYTIQGFWNYARQTVQYTGDYPGPVGPVNYLLLESGSNLLLESGTDLLLESTQETLAPVTSVQTMKHDGQSSDYAYRRVKLRGNGLAATILVSSVQGQPFHIVGWAIYETINQGV